MVSLSSFLIHFPIATTLLFPEDKSHCVSPVLNRHFCAIHFSTDTDSNPQYNLEGPALSSPNLPFSASFSLILLILRSKGTPAFFQFFKFVNLAVRVLVVAYGIFSCSVQTFSCGMWDLVPCPGIEPGPPALGM